MRPAVYLKYMSNEFVSVAPSMFGLIDYEGMPHLIGITENPIRLAGTLLQCVEEQEKAMKGKGSVLNRFRELKEKYGVE